MEQIMNYVKPELLIVAVVLYFIGMGIKKSEVIPDKYIPAILGALGILICGIYMRYIWRARNRNGNFYRNHTGNPRCRT